MRWVQFVHDLRVAPMGTPSPQTETQRAQVVRVLGALANEEQRRKSAASARSGGDGSKRLNSLQLQRIHGATAPVLSPHARALPPAAAAAAVKQFQAGVAAGQSVLQTLGQYSLSPKQPPPSTTNRMPGSGNHYLSRQPTMRGMLSSGGGGGDAGEANLYSNSSSSSSSNRNFNTAHIQGSPRSASGESPRKQPQKPLSPRGGVTLGLGLAKRAPPSLSVSPRPSAVIGGDVARLDSTRQLNFTPAILKDKVATSRAASHALLLTSTSPGSRSRW